MKANEREHPHAGVVEGDRWRLGQAPEVGALNQSERDGLGRYWVSQGRHCLAQSRWYGELGLVLMGLAAGPQLLRSVHNVAERKLGLVRRCFTLAAGYSGLQRDPNPASEPPWSVPVETAALAEVLVGRGLFWEKHRAGLGVEAIEAVQDEAIRAFLDAEVALAQQAIGLHWEALELLQRHDPAAVRRTLQGASSFLGVFLQSAQPPVAANAPEHGMVADVEGCRRFVAAALVRELDAWCHAAAAASGFED